MKLLFRPAGAPLIVLAAALAAAAEPPAVVVGLTEPFHNILISGSVSGIISCQKLHEGDHVKEGDVILELDKRIEELEEERRKLVMEQRKSDFESTRQLYSSTKSVSKEEMEKREAEYKIAAVEYQMAAEQHRKRLITAPVEGTISEIFLDLGEACEPRQPVLRIVDTRRCYFVANVEARHAGRLKLDQAVRLGIETGSAPLTVTARVNFISPVVDPGSGLFKIKAIFENTGGKVQPGLAARMILE